MIFILAGLFALAAAGWIFLQKRFGAIATGEQPLLVMHKTRLSLAALNALRKDVERKSMLGLPCVYDEPSPGFARQRVFEDETRSKLVSESVFEIIGGTDDAPIVRVIRTDDLEYPLGQDHYYAVYCLEAGEGAAIFAEERGLFGSVVKVAFRALELKLFLRNIAKGKYESGRPERGVHSSGTATDQHDSKKQQNAHARTTLAGEDRKRHALGRSGYSGARGRQTVAKNPTDYSQEILLSLLAFASFAIWLGWEGALLFAPMVLLHEYGHLLAYQLTGKTGNKMMLLPFFGGVAVAGEAHKNEFERSFCALMGPAICLPLSIALTAGAFYFEGSTASIGGYGLWWWFAYGAIICAFGNAINLAPVMPLDGGHVMQSISRSIAPTQAQAAMLVLTGVGALLMFQAGYEFIAGFAVIVGLPALFGPQDDNLPPLSLTSGTIMLSAYAATLGIHLGCAWLIYDRFY